MSLICVPSMRQKLVFFGEMKFQIFEGRWKNEDPPYHWKIWSQIRWEDVEVTSDYFGITSALSKEKRDYPFSDRHLLSVVGRRIRYLISLFNCEPAWTIRACRKSSGIWLWPLSLYSSLEYNTPIDYSILEMEGVSDIPAELPQRAYRELPNYSEQKLLDDCAILEDVFRTEILG